MKYWKVTAFNPKTGQERVLEPLIGAENQVMAKRIAYFSHRDTVDMTVEQIRVTKTTRKAILEYTFEEYWKETYGPVIDYWNAPLEMANKAKKDYQNLVNDMLNSL